MSVVPRHGRCRGVADGLSAPAELLRCQAASGLLLCVKLAAGLLLQLQTVVCCCRQRRGLPCGRPCVLCSVRPGASSGVRPGVCAGGCVQRCVIVPLLLHHVPACAVCCCGAKSSGMRSVEHLVEAAAAFEDCSSRTDKLWVVLRGVDIRERQQFTARQLRLSRQLKHLDLNLSVASATGGVQVFFSCLANGLPLLLLLRAFVSAELAAHAALRASAHNSRPSRHHLRMRSCSCSLGRARVGEALIV
jgi:hypothetical protein